jgi:RHS repeat-associated protein
VSYGYGSPGGVDDAAGRVASIASGSQALANYEYLGLGTVARVDYPEPAIENVLAGGGTNPDTGDIYTGLDRFGRIIDCHWRKYSPSPTTDIERVQYTYDRVGNRLTRQNLVAATTANNVWDEKYSYDALHRLTDMKRGTLSGGSISPLKFQQSWGLDATGNWGQFKQDDNGDGTWDLQQTRSANKVNAITSIGATTGPTWATPAYDHNGNMTTIPQTDDPTKTYTAQYDAWNRLVKLTDTATGNVVQENAYDGRGFRTIRKTYTSGSLTETRHLYYTESWQCVEERLGTSPSTATPDRQFVWGARYIDDLILRDRSVSGTLDERLYAQQDANWNVTAIANASGSVQERFGYHAYGHLSFLTPSFASGAPTHNWECLFAGYRYDDPAGLYGARNRVYQSRLGLWTVRDAIKYLASNNLFEYVTSSPICSIDPFGLLDAAMTPQQFFDDFRKLLTKDLPGNYAKRSSLWADTLDAGCIGVSLTLLGYPKAYERSGSPPHGNFLSQDPKKRASFENCYLDISQAKMRVIEMTEKNECCNNKGFNIYGDQPRAQLIAIHWSNKSATGASQNKSSEWKN